MPALAQETALDRRSLRVLKIAQAIAKKNMNGTLDPAHLLKAIIHKDRACEPCIPIH